MARSPNFIPAFAGDERPVRKSCVKTHVTVTLATLETSRFTFEGVGTNNKEAQSALRKALMQHGEQYGIAKNWYTHYGYPAEIVFRALTVGAGYRDEQLITD